MMAAKERAVLVRLALAGELPLVQEMADPDDEGWILLEPALNVDCCPVHIVVDRAAELTNGSAPAPFLAAAATLHALRKRRHRCGRCCPSVGWSGRTCSDEKVVDASAENKNGCGHMPLSKASATHNLTNACPRVRWSAEHMSRPPRSLPPDPSSHITCTGSNHIRYPYTTVGRKGRGAKGPRRSCRIHEERSGGKPME